MKIAQAILLGFVSTTAASDLAKPPTPVWPEIFTQSFTETTIVGLSKKTTKGRYFYNVSDVDSTLTRVDLENGQYDYFCRDGTNEAKKCSQFIAGSDRYVQWPSNGECCFCCSGDDCGVLPQDWMKDGKYIGTKKIGDYETYGFSSK